jgi:hypothetical protein
MFTARTRLVCLLPVCLAPVCLLPVFLLLVVPERAARALPPTARPAKSVKRTTVEVPGGSYAAADAAFYRAEKDYEDLLLLKFPQNLDFSKPSARGQPAAAGGGREEARGLEQAVHGLPRRKDAHDPTNPPALPGRVQAAVE